MRGVWKEAVAVGAVSVPIWFMTREVVKLKSWQSETQRDAWTTFLAGVAFHLLAEASGMNAW
jgi:hypothetical protein